MGALGETPSKAGLVEVGEPEVDTGSDESSVERTVGSVARSISR